MKTNRFKNNLVGLLCLGGMSLYGLSVPSAAFLQYITPKQPEIIKEYEALNATYNWKSKETFTLTEARNLELITHKSEEIKELKEKIQNIQKSYHTEISEYENKKFQHNLYCIIPHIMIGLGVLSGYKGIKLEEKINSHPLST